MANWKTAVVDEDGDRLAVFDSPRAAYDWAIRHGFTRLYADEILRRWADNPLGDGGPRAAWEAIGGLRVEWSDVERLSLQDAYNKLMALRMPRMVKGVLSDNMERVWPLTQAKSGSTVRMACWRNAKDASEALLRANDKLTRDHPVHRGRATSLSMLPSRQARDHLLGRVPGIDESTNLCVGANEECSASCLVFDARNESSPYNTRIKMAKTAALFAEPVAFCRLLYESCWRWLGQWGRRGAGERQPFVRLNAYSDVPWELVFPALFDKLPDLMFYDYTKVPARPEMCADVQSSAGVHVYRWPSNYDLTFSLSGTNDRDAHDEWHRGRRIAVVFNTDRHLVPQWYEPPFLGDVLPVLDGTIHDMRPLDPDARALERARKKLGPWTLGMTEKQRKIRVAKTTSLAYEITFGKLAPPRYEQYPARIPPIVGLVYKAPLKPERRAVAEDAQERGRLREARGKGKRAFLVSVMEKGKMVVAPTCPKTLSYVSPVIPAASTGILEMDDEDMACLKAAAKRTKPRKRRKSR